MAKHAIFKFSTLDSKEIQGSDQNLGLKEIPGCSHFWVKGSNAGLEFLQNVFLCIQIAEGQFPDKKTKVEKVEAKTTAKLKAYMITTETVKLA